MGAGGAAGTGIAGNGGATAGSGNASGGSMVSNPGQGGAAQTTASGGNTATMAGGTTGIGGTPPGSGGSQSEDPPMRSTGCGAGDWPASGDHTLDVDGTQREYIVKIPEGYDPNKPYRLIFAWHGLGGTANQIASGFFGGYYGLENRAGGSAIFVAGQGLETSQGGAGWPNTGGQDVAFVRAMLDWLRSSYCIDEARIFSVGMSYGGIMSNTVGCQLGDVFRAIAPMSGLGPRVGGFGGNNCVGQVAAWISHGNEDTIVQFSSGEASRDYWVEANHCQTTSKPVAPDPCVAYDGCDADYPVHWCEFDGGHMVPTFASEAIWNFLAPF